MLRTELELALYLLRIFPESSYISSAPTAQKTSQAAAIVAWRVNAAEMCLPLR
jgi:hypothetical protein